MNPHRAAHADHVNEQRTAARLITRRFETRLRTLDDRNGRLSGAALMLEDPRVIAAQIDGLATTLRIATLGGAGSEEDLAISLGAQVIALLLSLHRAHEVRIDVSDEWPEAAA